jgi:uncharacterized protein involved in exopolysaccharide biosynthesis
MSGEAHVVQPLKQLSGQMLHQYQRTVSMRDFCRVVFRHRSKAIAFFVIVMGLVLVGILLTPKKYLSETKLFVRLGRESVGLDPTATTGGQTISLNYSRESEIQSVQNLLESRVMFEQVVDKLGAALVLEEDLAKTPLAHFLDQLMERFSRSGPAQPDIQRERAIRMVLENTTVENPPKSYVFAISYKAGSPQRAQQVLQTYLDVCLEQYMRIHRNPSSREFFVEQSELLGTQVKEATQKLRDAKNEVGLVSVESQRKILEGYVSNLDRDMLSAQTEVASINDRIALLRQRVPEQIDEASASGLSSRALDDMRAQLYGLQIRERELLAKFTPEHPQAVAIHEQVQQAQRLLDRQELLIEISTAAALRARMQALSQQYEQTKSRLRELNENEVHIAELERRLEQLNASYRIYLTNLEQARIGQALEAEHITNITVAQTPTLVVKPLSRRAQLTLILGLMVAAFGGVGVAYLFEYFDDSLGTPLDVEARLGLPVLLSLPRSTEVTHPGGSVLSRRSRALAASG